MSDDYLADPETTLTGRIKSAIRDHNTEETRTGADVDEVVVAVAEASIHSEEKIRTRLNEMLLAGEVYPPREGRVRITP